MRASNRVYECRVDPSSRLRHAVNVSSEVIATRDEPTKQFHGIITPSRVAPVLYQPLFASVSENLDRSFSAS